MLFDITTVEKCLETVANYLDLGKEELLNYIEHHTYDFEVFKMLQDFNIGLDSLKVDDIQVVAFHLTSSDCHCNDIKKYGIMDVNHVLDKETSLSKFLQEHGIEFNHDYTYFTYKNTIYDITETDLYNQLVNENAIHCFLTVDDTGYFSEQLQIRPEIITMISEIVGEDSIKELWDLTHRTYMIKFIEDIENFDYYSIAQSKELIDVIFELLFYAVDSVIYQGTIEINTRMKKGHIINPEKITYSRQYYNN